jgi:hypothetical protein
MTVEVKGKRRGRPALPAAERRRRTISVRLSDAEHAALRKESAEFGRGNEIGRYLYEKWAGRVPPRIPAINREAWSRLGNVAGALTTIAKEAASRQLPALDRILLDELRGDLRAVRMALLGAHAAPEDDR